MSTTTAEKKAILVITAEDLRQHWQGHRRLTRRVMEAFPEKEFFEFSIGKMRPPVELMKELLAIAAPGLREMVLGAQEALNEHFDHQNSKQRMLDLWDEATEEIDALWKLIPEDMFRRDILAFGMYPGTGWSSVMYFIDNEIHHRGQAYVYLRALGIEPPFFWEK